MKQCPQCKRDGFGPKEPTEFNVSLKDASGRQSWCRACLSAYNKLHADTRRTGNRNWRANNVERARATHKAWTQRNPLAMTAKSLKSSYGVSVEQYAEMFAVQRGCCKICATPILSQLSNTRGLPRKTVAHVDHCHETGLVRGLLCFNCNIGLGKFRNDEQILLKAMRYLRITSQPRACETAEEISRVCDATAQDEKRVDASRYLGSSTSRGRRLQELSPFFH